jgi:Protein of unknown function (DUF3108)
MSMALHNQSRHVGLALAASLCIHAAIYFAVPHWATDFNPTNKAQVVRYDAALTPATPAPVVISATAVKPRAKPAPPTLKTETNFSAPENAIAVASDEITPDTAVAMPNVIAAAEASEQTPPPALEPAPAPVVKADDIVKKNTEKRSAPAFAERISIEYKLTSAITDGMANFKWTRKGTRYEIESSTEATGFLVSAFAGVIYQQSVGEITDEGLRPSTFSIRRGEGVTETAEFQRATNSLQFKGRRESRIVPLNRDMQDMQSFLFQLAFDAPRIAESGDNLDVLVTNARKVYRYQFKKMGIETLETRMGKIETIRLLSSAPNPEDAYEVWLAPQYFYLPVKIKLYLGKFPVEQLVTRIGIAGDSENTGNNRK